MKKIVIISLLLLISFSVKAEVRDNFLENTIFINEEKIVKLNDNNYKTKYKILANSNIKISSETNFKYIYIIYNLNTTKGNINLNNKNIKIGEKGFLHECIEIESTKEISISYEEDVTIKEIFVFDVLPAWVQRWEEPHTEADIMLLSTHSDDEHLFFAGLIPTMIDMGKKIQIVYMTNHNTTPERLDEQLNGLWAVGVKNYPIIGFVPDQYSTSLNGAIKNLNSSGFTENALIEFQIDMINRFKPLVIVAHDENGEYSHGQHILNTYSLKEALKIMELDSDNFLPTKVYIHLYKENTLKMNYDIPLNSFDGLTAYEVSKLGYAEHNSQQYTWFTKWLLGNNKNFTSATQIKTYSPLEYGLYFSTVGYEVVDNDLFYNIPIKEKDEDISEDIDYDEPNLDNNTEEKEENNNLKKYSIVLICFASLLLILLLIIKRKKK